MHGPLSPRAGYLADIATTADRVGPGDLGSRAKRLTKEVVDEFQEHDLLSYVSAISYQIIFTAVPLVLVALAVMGFLGLSETWTSTWAPEASQALSPAVFNFVNQTVESILTTKRGTWLTVGLLFALWKVSSVLRTVATPLNFLYDIEEDRPWYTRYGGSFLVACVLLPVTLLGLGGIVAGDQLAQALGVNAIAAWFVRWPLVVLLLLATVWLVLRIAPAKRPELHYVGLGAGVIVGGWIASTLLYGFYVTNIANYGSVFGNLATVVILMTYANVLAMVFLVGVAIDAALRRRMDQDGDGSDQPPAASQSASTRHDGDAATGRKPGGAVTMR